MILFSERKELADQYNKWLEENPQVLDCPVNVIAFLELNGRLKDKSEMWIPCSEKLPKKEGFYLCTIVGAYRSDYRKVVKCWFSENYNDFMEYSSRVVAWKPLDEPYKEGCAIDD